MVSEPNISIQLQEISVAAYLPNRKGEPKDSTDS